MAVSEHPGKTLGCHLRGFFVSTAYPTPTGVNDVEKIKSVALFYQMVYCIAKRRQCNKNKNRLNAAKTSNKLMKLLTVHQVNITAESYSVRHHGENRAGAIIFFAAYKSSFYVDSFNMPPTSISQTNEWQQGYDLDFRR